MKMHEAIELVSSFLEEWKSPAWNPAEIVVRPSGDDMFAIKVWLGFGPETDTSLLERLRIAPVEALRKAHPELQDYKIECRVEVMSFAGFPKF